MRIVGADGEELDEASPSQSRASDKWHRGKHADVDDVAPAVRIEDDLAVEECGSEDEVQPLHAPWTKLAARRRMVARSQQCVVCMEEREHTFVPIHTEGSGDAVQSHRFCCDCWLDFMDHCLRQPPQVARSGVLGRSCTPAPLTCPVCRSNVVAPDVWGVEYDLPETWLRPARASSSHKLGLASLPVADEVESAGRESMVWVDTRCFPHSGGVASSALETDAPISESGYDCRPSSGASAPLCRRVWNSAVQQGAHCLRGVMRVACSAVSVDMLTDGECA